MTIFTGPDNNYNDVNDHDDIEDDDEYWPGTRAAAAPAQAARLGGGPAAARQRSQAAHLYTQTYIHFSYYLHKQVYPFVKSKWAIVLLLYEKYALISQVFTANKQRI